MDLYILAMHENLGSLIQDVAARHGERVATRVRVGDAWVTQTFADFVADMRSLAAQFIARGLQPGDRVALFSGNRPEWTLADFACVMAGAVLVPIYQTSTPPQIQHVISDSGARWAIVAGESEWSRLLAVRADLPLLEAVFTMDAVPGADVPTLAELVAQGGSPEAVDARIADQHPGDVMTIIYTSGTTGIPKGVMLTHRTYLHQFAAIDANWDISPDEHSLCFLPLSHALERVWTYYVLSRGCMNTYVTDPKTIAAMLVLAQPTMLVSVPKLYEKVYQAAHAKVADSPVKQAIFDWALRVGGQMQHAYRKGKQPALFWRVQLPLADRLVLRNIRDAIGGHKSLLVSGGAPLRVEVEEFFSAAGLLLAEGYGLTESGPMITIFSPQRFKLGTVGYPIPGAEFRIGEGGELLVRAPSIMTGYWNNPEATAAAIVEGWLHTGDVGYIDTDGYVVITDRIKDLIVTSSGKNIAPGPIEAQLASDPLIEYAVILGDNRPCLTLLVQPSLPDLEALATNLRIQWQRREELLSHPQILDELRRRVSAATEKLDSHEQIRDLRVLRDGFTQENGLLTPTLKVRRREVERRFSKLIDEMYAAIASRKGTRD